MSITLKDRPHPLCVLEDPEHVVAKGVSVLLQESVDLVEDITSVVLDAILHVVDFGLDVVAVVLQKIAQES